MTETNAEKTHELYELLSIKKILDSYKGGLYFVALNAYVDSRIMELVGVKFPQQE